MAHSSPKLIFGAFGISLSDKPTEFLDLLKQRKVLDLDTAYIYPGSEESLGALGAPKDFVIHTKAPGFSKGSLSKQSVLDGMEESLKRLGVDHVGGDSSI